jgi:hypothetical protein
VLGDLMHALAHASAGALRLRIEGRSAARTDRLPRWIERGTEFTILDFLEDEPGVVIGARPLIEALPARFEQQDLFTPFDPSRSAIALMLTSFSDAAAARADSDAFDADLLGVFHKDFRRLLRAREIEGVSVRNGHPDAPPVSIDRDALEVVHALRDRTPSARRVRVAGKVDVIRYSTCALVLTTPGGTAVRGVLTDGDPERLRPLYGRDVLVEGLAQFRPSGRLLRLDIDRVSQATADDLEMFSALPLPLDGENDLSRFRRRQSAHGGINAIVGQWPGDESDEETDALLRAIQ